MVSCELAKWRTHCINQPHVMCTLTDTPSLSELCSGQSEYSEAIPHECSLLHTPCYAHKEAVGSTRPFFRTSVNTHDNQIKCKALYTPHNSPLALGLGRLLLGNPRSCTNLSPISTWYLEYTCTCGTASGLSGVPADWGDWESGYRHHVDIHGLGIEVLHRYYLEYETPSDLSASHADSFGCRPGKLGVLGGLGS
jgi:hypothetical protein